MDDFKNALKPIVKHKLQKLRLAVHGAVVQLLKEELDNGLFIEAETNTDLTRRFPEDYTVKEMEDWHKGHKEMSTRSNYAYLVYKIMVHRAHVKVDVNYESPIFENPDYPFFTVLFQGNNEDLALNLGPFTI
jgi:hypothetical protein